MLADFGRSLVQLGQLVFGSIVLGAILAGKIDRLELIFGGAGFTAVLIAMGILLSNMLKES
jgi:hypothetical protein